MPRLLKITRWRPARGRLRGFHRPPAPIGQNQCHRLPHQPAASPYIQQPCQNAKTGGPKGSNFQRKTQARRKVLWKTPTLADCGPPRPAHPARRASRSALIRTRPSQLKVRCPAPTSSFRPEKPPFPCCHPEKSAEAGQEAKRPHLTRNDNQPMIQWRVGGPACLRTAGRRRRLGGRRAG